MIWPQQYHKEKQEMERPIVVGLPRSQIAAAQHPSAPSQPVEAPGEQSQRLPTTHSYVTEGQKNQDAYDGSVGSRHAPQSEAPAAKQWHMTIEPAPGPLNWQVINEDLQFAFSFGAGEYAKKQATRALAYLNAQQRVLDVNPESPADATRGDGEDPIPQRECEHKWEWRRSPSCDRFICAHCAAIKLAPDGVIYLPQPIDPRSEAR